MMCGPPKPSHPAKTISESNAFTVRRWRNPRRETHRFLSQSIAASNDLHPKILTPRPHLIVPEHGCAFELQNHREYGVTSCRAKGVCEKNLMVRNNLSL
jgi:hypothetical protein